MIHIMPMPNFVFLNVITYTGETNLQPLAVRVMKYRFFVVLNLFYQGEIWYSVILCLSHDTERQSMFQQITGQTFDCFVVL